MLGFEGALILLRSKIDVIRFQNDDVIRRRWTGNFGLKFRFSPGFTSGRFKYGSFMSVLMWTFFDKLIFNVKSIQMFSKIKDRHMQTQKIKSNDVTKLLK